MHYVPVSAVWEILDLINSCKWAFMNTSGQGLKIKELQHIEIFQN